MAAEPSRDRRPAWLPLVAAAIVVPSVLSGLTLLWPRPQIEDQLTRTAGEALSSAGISGADVTLDGRDVTISGIAPADAQRAVDAVQAVTGVRVARVPDAGGGGTGSGGAGSATDAGAVQAEPFGIARRGEDIVLTGVVGSQDERASLLAAATAQAGGRTVVDELTITPGAPLPDGVDATAVGAAAGVLATGPGELAVTFSADGVALTGTVADDAAKAATAAALAAALPGSTLDNRLTVTPPTTTAAPATTAPPAPTPAPSGGELDAAAKQQLQAGIDELVAAAPITFGPDSPRLTAQGRATLDRVLALVAPATGARLQIDGFVASGPGNGRLTAQQLSDQRAAAVRDALVADGVPADRIAARGLGEATAPGDRAAGRRVEITVV